MSSRDPIVEFAKCEHCKHKFVKRRADARFCSGKCRAAHHYRVNGKPEVKRHLVRIAERGENGIKNPAQHETRPKPSATPKPTLETAHGVLKIGQQVRHMRSQKQFQISMIDGDQVWFLGVLKPVTTKVIETDYQL